MRGDRTLLDGSDARSESAMRSRPACAVPKPSRDGRNTIANQQRLRQPLRQPTMARLLQRRSSPDASCHRCVVDGGCMLRHRLGSALPMSHLDVRKGDGGALLQRGHWGVSPTADSVKCEGTEKAKGVA